VEKPEDFTHAARRSGLSRHVCRRLWQRGYPDWFPWAKPMAPMFQDAETLARAMREMPKKDPVRNERPKPPSAQVVTDTVKSLATADAARTRALEGLAIRDNLEAAAAMSGGIRDITDSLKPHLEQLAKKYRKMAANGDFLASAELIELLDSVSKSATRIGDFLKVVMELERKRMGLPEQHVGIVATVRGMDDDERRELLRKKRQQLARKLEMLEQGAEIVEAEVLP